MKKIIALSFLAFVTNIHAMKEQTQPKSQSVYQRLCQFLDGIFQSGKKIDPFNDAEESLVQQMNALSLNRPNTLKFANTHTWDYVLRFLTPTDLLNLAQTNSQILRSIQSAPAFHHQYFCDQKNEPFYDYDKKFSDFILNHQRSEALFKSCLVAKHPQYSIAKSCAHLVPMIINHDQKFNLFPAIKKFFLESRIFLVGDDSLLEERDLYPKICAVAASLDSLRMDLDFTQLRHILFFIKTENFDENQLAALKRLPHLTHFFVTHREKKDNPESFFVQNLVQIRPCLKDLQEFIYNVVDDVFHAPTNIPKNDLEKIWAELLSQAPNLKRFECLSHVLEEVPSFVEKLKYMKSLEIFKVAGAKKEGFAVLDFLGPEIKEVKLPLIKNAKEDVSFAHQKTCDFLQTHQQLRSCKFKLMPDDLEADFEPLFSGYSRQKNLHLFACTLSCAQNLEYLIKALPCWKALKYLNVNIFLGKNTHHNTSLYDHLINALVNSALFAKHNFFVNPVFRSSIKSILNITSDNEFFLMYMMERLPTVQAFYGEEECKPQNKAKIYARIKEEKASSLIDICFYLKKTKY